MITCSIQGFVAQSPPLGIPLPWFPGQAGPIKLTRRELLGLVLGLLLCMGIHYFARCIDTTVVQAKIAGDWSELTKSFNGSGAFSCAIPSPGTDGGWVPWKASGVRTGGGEEGAFADAVAEQTGAVWVPPTSEIIDYDADGNRESNAQWDYGWDGRNKLVRARTKYCTTAPEGGSVAPHGYDITFDYDAEGRRFQKIVKTYVDGKMVSQDNITFVWDGWEMIYEIHQTPNGVATLERKYVWGPDIAGGVGGDTGAGGAGGLLLIRETRGTTTTDLYPLYDGSGHVVGLTDSNKTLQAEYAYGPFGELIHAKGPMAKSNPFRYATKFFDAETGLYYFGQRYLDPVTGQWLNREPLGEDESLNLYAYCHNDPVNRIDVQGLEERVIAGTKPVFAEDPSNKDFVFMGFPLEEDGWFRPFQPNGKHSFIPMVMSKEAAMQHLQNPESLNRLRSAAGGYLNEAHAHAKVFYIDNSVGLVGGVGEMTAGIAAAPESAGVSMVATVHGFDVASTRWQRLWAGPESDIQSGTSQLLQLIPGVDRGTAEIGDNLISLATAGSSMYVMGKAPLVYTPRLYSPAAKTPVPHKNSLDYVGDTHVYRVKAPDGSTYKIGESAQGTRVRDGASIRAEKQARELRKETGDIYETDIRKTFPDKASARDYETRVIERFRRMYGDNTLPGNKTNR